MFSTNLIRITHVFALAAVVAFLAAPAVALGDSTSGAATPDSFERYAAAHPFGHDTATATPDAFERYAAAHPYGHDTATATPDTFERYAAAHPYGHDTVTATPDAFERYAAAHPYGHDTVTISDGRSPDTVDAAGAAQLQVTDGRSPDTRDAAVSTGLQVFDGRSPDTLDATQTVQPIELVSPGGFDWADAGIGAGMGAGIITLLGVVAIALMTHRSRRVQAA